MENECLERFKKELTDCEKELNEWSREIDKSIRDSFWLISFILCVWILIFTAMLALNLILSAFITAIAMCAFSFIAGYYLKWIEIREKERGEKNGLYKASKKTGS